MASYSGNASENTWDGSINTTFRDSQKITYTDLTAIAFYGLGFNASKSNPIYSDSVSTVRVDALRGYWLIRF